MRKLSVRTLWRWLKALESGGIDGLEPAIRAKTSSSQVLSAELLEFLKSEREQDPYASVPELIRRARGQDILGPDEPVHRATVWRAMCRMGLSTRPGALPKEADTRRFEHRERMQCVLVDGKHFRAGHTRRRRVALYYLDDATRFGLGAVVTTSENARAALLGLHLVLLRFGLMTFLYWDHGPGFFAKDVQRVAANLGVGAVYGRVGYKEGRGKIERFLRSTKARVLRDLAGHPEVDPDCGALTLRLRHDLFEVYNHTPHSALGGQTPAERWHQSGRALRPVPGEAWLRERFSVPRTRRVSKDHIISYEGVEYELPRGYAGQEVTLHHRLLEVPEQGHALYLAHHGELQRLHPVDKHRNAHQSRARVAEVKPQPERLPPSASARKYAAEMAPLVDETGGFSLPQSNEETP